MNANPDTSLKAVLSSVEQTEANLENLGENPDLNYLVEKFLNDSVISSFFNGPLALAISRPLFKLRYHKVVSKYLMDKGMDMIQEMKDTVGENKRDVFSSTFRNDLVMYLLQNAIRKYSKSDSYMSLNSAEMSVADMKSNVIGAFVKKGTLYIDEARIKQEFLDKAWVINSEAENSYEKLGLHALPAGTFTGNNNGNLSEYTKFVAEREYLRSTFPQRTDETKAEYEKFLANRALDNTFNLFHLFKDEDNNFAKRYTELLEKYPRLVNRFEVLKKIGYDELRTKIGNNNVLNVANLKLNDRDMNSSKANLYTTNIKNLSSPVYLRKLGYKDGAATEISQFFNKLSMYAYIQSGLNKTPYSLTSIVDYTDFANILKQESEAFIKVLDSAAGQTVLNDFNNLFLAQNNISRGSEKGRLKDFVSNIDFRTVKATETITKATQPQASVSTNVKKGVEELFKSNPKLASIGTQEQYSQYLNTVFPDSKVKDIVYHGTDAQFDKFDKSFYQSGADYIYFGKLNTPGFKSLSKTISAIINLINPSTFIDNNTNKVSNDDGFIEDYSKNFIQSLTEEQFEQGEFLNQYGVKKPEQIHTLGSKQDIEGFKNFVSTQPQAETADFLEETDRENVVSFNDVEANFDFYKAMVKSHPNVIFITNPAVTDIQTKFEKPETNQAKFAKLAGVMSIAIPTDLRPGDNMKTFPAEKYNDYKAMVERKIADIKTAMQNQPVAFSKVGYGNAYSMPQELFVYLSKRLFEEFGYINPGSAMDNELNNQDIDDTEILESLGFETDPFKC
jgi:hypothetical protein